MSAVHRFVVWLAGAQASRPWMFLFAALLTVGPSYVLARNLELRTGFDELLPDDQPSVIELRRTRERLPGMSSLIITAESKDTALLKRFVDETTPKLRSLSEPTIVSVDDGPRDVQRFFEKHKHLYADLTDLEQLHQEVTARYDWEIGRALGTNLDDEVPAPITSRSVAERFEKRVEEARRKSPGTDGYYIGENGHLAVIVVRTSLGAMDQRAFELQSKIEKIIQTGNYKGADPDFRHGFAGNLITSAAQYRAVTEDLVGIGIAGGLAVLAVVYFFFLRVRALLALGVCVSLGCLWCFAFAELAIGHLNTATGFLVSVIAGNGINTMVIYMARYLEARRDQGLDVARAVRTASVDTYAATFAAVAVAMVAYGALMVTEFRGFRHFGVIGSAGMLACWISSYLVLPPLLVLSERIRPLPTKHDWRDRLSGLYGRPFVWMARRFAPALALIGVLSGIVAVVCTASYFSRDSMEYDLYKIRSDSKRSSVVDLQSRVNQIIGRLNQNGRAVLVERLDQVEPLVRELERRRDAAPPDRKPFEEVVSIFSLLPNEQNRKIELLKEILERVQRAKQRGFISAEQWKELEPHLPTRLEPLTIADLPELVARPFEEKDGTRGKIVYVAPTKGRSLYDARYLILWADGFRKVELPGGDIIRGTGDAVVFSDMLLKIAHDAPRAALLSFLGTAAVILIAFRGRRSAWAALATLALGVGWVVAVLNLADIKLNFLNFMALPIAIGVGADYTINVLKRREIEGAEGVERAFIETGGAVVACSMTTLSGYAALLFSENGAIRSLGFAAGLGELATQLSAMLVLPACIQLLERRRSNRAQHRTLECEGKS